MQLFQFELSIDSSGRGTYDVTRAIGEQVSDCGIRTGLCTVFVHHTSASLVICENADPEVRSDLEAWLARAVPDGDPLFRHTQEGQDDMPAHVRTALTQTSVVIPVRRGELDLGVWQGVYLYEHRRAAHRRRVSLTVVGE